MRFSGAFEASIRFHKPYAPKKALCVGGGRVLLLLRNYSGSDSVVPMDVRTRRWGAALLTAFFIADIALDDRGTLAAVVSTEPSITAPRLIIRHTAWRPHEDVLHPRAAAAAAVVRLLPLPPELVAMILSFVGPWNLGR